MWLFKIPVKIRILPVILVLGIFNVLGNVVTNPSCYVFGPALFLLLGLAFFSLTQHTWLAVSILTVLRVACLAIPMLAGLVVCVTEDRSRLLMRFLFS